MKIQARFLLPLLCPLLAFAKSENKDLMDLPVNIRTKLVQQAKPFREGQNSSIDVVELLKKECGFEYSRSERGKPTRPQIECTYLPRDPANPFGGMMAKFDCQIGPNEAESKKAKVKYDPGHHAGGGYKEVPQAIMGSLFSRLIGLQGNLFCPVDLICKDCPSQDPWSQANSQAPGVPGNRVPFKNVVLEKKLKGTKILSSTSKPTHPAAFTFQNDFVVQLPEENKMESQADREAMAIWVNFIRHRDAGAYNMALTCHGLTVTDGFPSCEKVSASINDFGDSFGYRNINRKIELSKFEDAPGVVLGRHGFVTEGASGTSKPDRLTVSAAGVQRFLKAVDQISNQQLSDVFDLAQIETVSDARKSEWIQAFRLKVENIRQLSREQSR